MTPRSSIFTYFVVGDKKHSSESTINRGDDAQEDQDYVWDVYYHSALAPIEWADNPLFAAMLVTKWLYVSIVTDDFEIELICQSHLRNLTAPMKIQKLRTKQMRIQMV